MGRETPTTAYMARRRTVDKISGPPQDWADMDRHRSSFASARWARRSGKRNTKCLYQADQRVLPIASRVWEEPDRHLLSERRVRRPFYPRRAPACRKHPAID